MGKQPTPWVLTGTVNVSSHCNIYPFHLKSCLVVGKQSGENAMSLHMSDFGCFRSKMLRNLTSHCSCNTLSERWIHPPSVFSSNKQPEGGPTLPGRKPTFKPNKRSLNGLMGLFMFHSAAAEALINVSGVCCQLFKRWKVAKHRIIIQWSEEFTLWNLWALSSNYCRQYNNLLMCTLQLCTVSLSQGLLEEGWSNWVV